MQILMNATHNENGSVINGEPYTHRYYRISEKLVMPLKIAYP